MKKYLVVVLLLTGCAVQEAGAMQGKWGKKVCTFLNQKSQKRYNATQLSAREKSTVRFLASSFLAVNTILSYHVGEKDGEAGGFLNADVSIQRVFAIGMSCTLPSAYVATQLGAYFIGYVKAGNNFQNKRVF